MIDLNIFIDFRDRNKPDFRNRAQSGHREDDDPERVLSREELERERPQVKPWEVNPEFVPKGRYYFEVSFRSFLFLYILRPYLESVLSSKEGRYILRMK